MQPINLASNMPQHSYPISYKKLQLHTEQYNNNNLVQELLHYKRDELKKLWLDGVEQKHVLDLLNQIGTYNRPYY